MIEIIEVYIYIVVSIHTDKGIYSTMVQYVCIHVWNKCIVCTLKQVVFAQWCDHPGKTMSRTTIKIGLTSPTAVVILFGRSSHRPSKSFVAHCTL